MKDLVGAAQAGERNARNEIVERHRDPLDRYLRLRIGSHLRARVELEDVFQETFAKAFESLDVFHWQGEGSFLRWLKSIAENRILALAKKYRREDLLFVEEREPSANDQSPSGSLRRGERFERLRAALDRLEPDYREVIVLARLEGLGLREVARRMNRSQNAIAHLLSRALARLKDAFGDTASFSLPARRFDETKRGGLDREA